MFDAGAVLVNLATEDQVPGLDDVVCDALEGRAIVCVDDGDRTILENFLEYLPDELYK